MVKENRKKTKRSNRSNRIKTRAAYAGIGAYSALMFATQNAYADKFSSAVDSAANGIQMSATGVVRGGLVIVAVIIGLILLFGTQRQREEAKNTVFIRILGAAVVLGATAYAGIIFGWLS